MTKKDVNDRMAIFCGPGCLVPALAKNGIEGAYAVVAKEGGGIQLPASLPIGDDQSGIRRRGITHRTSGLANAIDTFCGNVDPI